MPIGSLRKAFQIVDLLMKHPKGLRLSEIGKAADAPVSTIHHILNTLRSFDYIDQDLDSKRYRLGFKFLMIGRAVLDNLDIRNYAFDHLRKLQQKCNETVNLYILRNGKATLVDKIQKVGGLSLDTFIGFSTDPHAAASGKVLLSDRPKAEILQLYETRPLKVYGKNTITNMSDLLEELENVHRQGYAIDNEEHYEGVRCVAAPIRTGGRIKAAVSITGSVFSMTMERINTELIQLVKTTANEISSELPE